MLMPAMKAERQRLSIDPYYTPLSHVLFDPSSPYSSPSSSPSSFPSSAISFHSNMAHTPTTRTQPEWRIGFVLCLYDFDPTDPDHLPFEKNDILEIVRKEESGWWAALRNDVVGWIPSAFVCEITLEDVERLVKCRPELRVCEYEAEKLFSEPTPSPDPLRTTQAVQSYYNDSWDRHIDTNGKDSVVVVTDFPDDVVPPLSVISPHPHSHISSDRLDEYWVESDAFDARKQKHLSQPLLRPSAAVSSIPNRLRRPSLQTKIPPAPSQPSPSATSPRSPLNRSRSKSSPTALTRSGRRRPVTTSSFKSLSSLSVELDSPQSETDDLPQLERDTASLTLASSQKRSEKIRKLTGDDDAQAFHNARAAQASLPWYLKPSYTADDIKMEYDGSVRAGTLPALVERLTADSLKMSQEKLYRDVCLSTFHTFTTATELFDLFIERFNMLCPLTLTQKERADWQEKKLIPVQKRILAILTTWITDYGLAFENPEIIPFLRSFLFTVVSPASSVLTAKLALQQLEKTTQLRLGVRHGGSAQVSWSPQSPILVPRRRRQSKNFKNDLLKVDPANLAGHLMLYEYQLYAKIRPKECYTWAKRQTGDGLDNLLAFSNSHDFIAAWVKSSVLVNDGIGRRSDTVDFWIKVAEKCRAIDNFSSMSAIVAALSSDVLSRLKLTWVHVGRISVFTSLTRLMDPSSNFSKYRTALQGITDGPCIPFIAPTLSHIVHINDRYKDIAYYPLVSSSSSLSEASSPPSHVDGFNQSSHSSTSQSFPNLIIASPRFFPTSSSAWPQTASSVQSTFELRGPPLINIVKRRKWFEVTQSILRFQTKTPVVQENTLLQQFMLEQLANASAKAKDPSTFWERSNEVQQSEIAQADIRKGLEAAGF